MKKFLFPISLFCLFFLSGLQFPLTVYAELCGDVNNDNIVTAVDAMKTLRAAIGLETFTETQKKLADVAPADNPDGAITVVDALLILRTAIGLTTVQCKSDSTNRTPTITSTAVTTATVGVAYSYDVNATDADGDTLTYSLTCQTCQTTPTINSTTGLISWTPTATGTYNVAVSVSDGKGGTARQSWTVTVISGGGGVGGNVSKISAGYSHTCAVLNDSTVKCWGGSIYGQLGNGNTSGSSTPVSVSNIINAVSVTAGGEHTCAVLLDGTVKCWGYNGGSGRLGNGNTTNSSTPVSVSNITNAVSVTAGGEHTCAILLDGTVKCWGYNGSGRLGNGNKTNSSTPVSVSNITNVVSVTAGVEHTCAVLLDGTVKCWGYNGHGELGNGFMGGYSLTPISVSNITNAISVTAGYYHTCAVLNDNTVKCWGENGFGQLDNGNITYSSTPVNVSNITNAISVTAGYYHTCAVLNDGTVKCWGKNDFGQLGNGNTTNSSAPVSVGNIINAISVSAGEQHTCAVLLDGTVKCWGYNGYGQLGNGSTTNSNMPVSVVNFP